MRQAAIAAVVRRSWAALADGRGTSGETWLVPDGPEDVAIAESLLVTGARLAPGGVRWLADRWSAEGLASDGEASVG